MEDTDFVLIVGIDDATQANGNKDEVPFPFADESEASEEENRYGLHDVPDTFEIRLRRLQQVTGRASGARKPFFETDEDSEQKQDGEFDFSSMCKTDGMMAYTGHCG